MEWESPALSAPQYISASMADFFPFSNIYYKALNTVYQFTSTDSQIVFSH